VIIKLRHVIIISENSSLLLITNNLEKLDSIDHMNPDTVAQNIHPILIFEYSSVFGNMKKHVKNITFTAIKIE
jgi:hypothetical protein